MNRRCVARYVLAAGLAAVGAVASSTPGAHGATVLPRTRLAGYLISINSVALDRRTGHLFVTDARHDTASMLSAATGAVLRTVAVGSNPLGVAVDAQTGHVFIANSGRTSSRGSISVLDAASGALLRTVATGMDIGAVTVDETTARVFFPYQIGFQDGVGVLDARIGTLLHTVPVPIISSPTVVVDERMGRAFVTSASFNMLSQPLPGANMISALDAKSGALRRRIPLPHGPIAVAVDDHTDHIFSANFDGTASTLDAGTGAVVRTVPLAPFTLGNAVAVDSQTGHVFVSDYNLRGTRGHVSILDARSGALLQTVTVGNGPIAVAVATRSGHAFVLSQSGITMLDTRSGRVLRTITVMAGSMAVDEQTGRVFVTAGRGRVGIIDAVTGVPLVGMGS